MTSLIVRSGMRKTAAPEDGPSFEQQFGILANAVIVDKFPQLDNMKLAFQLIDKDEDNANAVGAMVYLLGTNVIFVPAFFKNQQLKTADMMFLAQSQQFLPLADPWLAWIRDKDLKESGEPVDSTNGTQGATADSTLVREYTDPITKTAAVYLKMLGSLPFDPTDRSYNGSVLDTALSLGKEASGVLCDNLVKNAGFLNAMLEFYSGDEIDRFAKHAAYMDTEEESVKLILPFTKEAAGLAGDDLKRLQSDGYLVKTAEEMTSSVIVKPQIANMFGTVTAPCHASLLDVGGTLHPVTILQKTDRLSSLEQENDTVPEPEPVKHPGDPGMTASSYISDGVGKFVVLYEDTISELPANSMILLSGKRPVTSLDINGNTDRLDSLEKLDWDTYLIFPDGTCHKWEEGACIKTGEGRWTSERPWGSSKVVLLGVNEDQVSPMKTGDMIVLPADTRYIKVKSPADYRLSCAPVTLSTFDSFLTEFCRKHYDKARVYSNGSDITVSGDKTASVHPVGKGEAAFALVRDYGVDPDIARSMLKEACSQASYDSPKSITFYITKTAVADPMWENASIPMGEHQDRPPQTNYMSMPTVLESPEQLQKAVETAAQKGIKEVFDVTALKLLVKQTRFFDGIQEDMPLFMRTLDSLCRKLFQFYWHTDKMEEKYGLVKLKSLEDSLKATIDSLSELTIFFKLRTVDGTGSTGDTVGDLMSGQML